VIRPADCLWGYLTPREHLTFHALAASIHRASLHKAVEELLGLMGLEGCADVLVREVGKGERRRLHLATHLLANPAVSEAHEKDRFFLVPSCLWG
jgi:ABC-type multidrug transport system ATPase subunit